MKNRVNTSQKHTIDSQKNKENISIIQKEIIKAQKEEQKGTQKKYNINGKIRFKMAINTYLSIISLKLNVPTKRHRLTEWIQKQDPCIYMLSTRDPLQTWGDIQTESEGMEKVIPCKWKSKESWSSYTHIR